MAALSARYCTCEHIGRRGKLEVFRSMPNGGTIGGLVDNVVSDSTNWEDATSIIDRTTKDWINDFNPVFRDQVYRNYRIVQ